MGRRCCTGRPHTSRSTYVVRLAVFDEGGGEDFRDLDVVVAPPCTGDCNDDGVVSVAELIEAIRIGLGTATPGNCPRADPDGNGAASIDEIVQATANALNGCESV